MENPQLHTPAPSLTVRVIEAVAERAGVDETELPPLGDVIDPDALESLFGSSLDSAVRAPAHVQFSYGGYSVVVGSDGVVTVE